MKNKIAGLIIALFAMFAFTKAKAQCPSVYNGFACSMNVLVQFYDCNMFVCGSYNLTVPANTTLPLNCSSCPSYCQISITILDINGVTITPIPKALIGTPPPGSFVNTPSGCGPTGGLWFKTSSNTFVAQ